jgi:hypothetical protein
VAGLTATFDQDAAQWTGTWLFDGQTREVVLERPHPAKGVTLNQLCGDWEAALDAKSPTSIRIHIAQSSDGTLAAWMDALSVVQDQNYGAPWTVISANPMSVILRTEAVANAQLRQFSGVLSDDRNNITGHWNESPTSATFRRIPQEELSKPFTPESRWGRPPRR